MPLYQYECTKCGGDFSATFKVEDRGVPLEDECPFCCTLGSVRRLVGNNGGFRLGSKGSVSWAKGGYSSFLGDVVKCERK